MMMMMNEDMVTEILVRLPSKSVLRCGAASPPVPSFSLPTRADNPSSSSLECQATGITPSRSRLTTTGVAGVVYPSGGPNTSGTIRSGPRCCWDLAAGCCCGREVPVRTWSATRVQASGWCCLYLRPRPESAVCTFTSSQASTGSSSSPMMSGASRGERRTTSYLSAAAAPKPGESDQWPQPSSF